MRTLFSSLVVTAVLASLVAPAGAQSGGLVRVWDVKDTNQAGQLTIYNDDDNGSLAGEPVGSGDVDGDGYDDVVTCAFYAPAGPTNGRPSAGKAHVWFGGPNVLDGGVVYDAGNPTARTVEIWGGHDSDFLGTEVDVADVTGDGIADILLCAENSGGFGNASTRDHAGSLYLVEGSADLTGPIDLANPPAGVHQFLGARAGDRFGFWVTAGDVDGDGVADIVVSADLAKGSSGSGNARGAAYVIPGGRSFPARVDMASASDVRDLRVTTIYGVDDADHFGASLVTGDFDGDGLRDVAIGAGLSRLGAAYQGHDSVNNALGQGGGDGPNNDREDAGEVYVVFGRASWPTTIQMSSPPSDVTIVYGDQQRGYFGEDVRAGDVDGDGKDELGVGALTADPPDRAGGGIGYVFWSGQFGRGKRVDARTANAATMTAIYGQRANDTGADSILLADIDDDGFADVLFGSPTNTPIPARQTAGDLKVIFGSAARFPGVVDTANPPAGVTVYQLYAADPGDMFTYSITVGDVDGDGTLDIVPNSMGGDGSENRHEQAGDAFVISGRVFADRTGRGPDAPGCLSRVTASPDLDRYYAGQTGITLTLTCDSGEFVEGTVALIRGVEVPTEFVSANELRVSLDAAPDVLNASGQLTVQTRNPEGGPSAAVLSITLVGPTAKKAKIAASGDEYVITVKGKTFLTGATATVTDASGAEIPVTSSSRKDKKTVVVRIAKSSVASGDTLTVVVDNPGPAPSNALTVVAP